MLKAQTICVKIHYQEYLTKAHQWCPSFSYTTPNSKKRFKVTYKNKEYL